MSEHNFEIGDVVTMKAPFKAVYEGTVVRIYKQVIKVNFLCGDDVYISNYMLYTLTNITKQQKAKEQQMKDHNITPKNIKPEDEVTITTTYRELAEVYFIIGSSNGKSLNLYEQCSKLLNDPKQSKRRSLITSNFIDYLKYQYEFEALLFPQEPIETEQQKQIRELREQAEAMQEQSKMLLEKAKTLEENQK